MSTIHVQTAQNVALEYEVASVGDRILAQLLDWLVLLLFSVVVNFLIEKATSSQDERRILLMLLIALPWLLYQPLCEIFFNGQSIGKRARQIKVTRRDGLRPHLGDYLLRWLLGLLEVSASFGSIATVAVLLNGHGQRLGDMAANTMVVSLRPAPATGSLPLADLPAGYMVVFPQVSTLSDQDINLVRRLMHQALKRNNYMLLHEVANKVKALTSIQTDLQDEPFLHTILQDHASLAATDG
jgi:uncharacterized RDD family membrane protein YckC